MFRLLHACALDPASAPDPAAAGGDTGTGTDSAAIDDDPADSADPDDTGETGETGDSDVSGDTGAAPGDALRIDGREGDYLSYPAGASVGDVDGDGRVDLLTGGAFAGEDAMGRAWLFSGVEHANWQGDVEDRAGTSFDPDAQTRFFGVLGTRQADLTGDGTDDVAIGGSDAMGGIAVGVWAGGTRSERETVDTAWATIRGAQGGFARILGHLDLDADGLAEIVYSDLHGGTEESGEVWIIPGGALHSPVDAQFEDLAATTIDSRVHCAYTGSTLSGGDLDGDGRDDLAVGGHGQQDCDVRGAIHLFSGVSLRPGVLHVEDEADATLTADDRARLAWWAPPATGDFDGNGALDLAVGAPGDSMVSVFLDVSALWGAETDVRDADTLLQGDPDAYLGMGVTSFDPDGDGTSALAAGAPDALGPDGSGDGATGTVYLVEGSAFDEGGLVDEIATSILPGTVPDEEFGSLVGAGADWDEDGRDDLLVGARANDAGGVGAGRLYVLQ